MKIEELKTILENIGCPQEYYSINGQEIPSGINMSMYNGTYDVYCLGDRGGRFYLAQYLQEEEACDIMFREVKKMMDFNTPASTLPLKDYIDKAKKSSWYPMYRKKVEETFASKITAETYLAQDGAIYSKNREELVCVSPLHEYSFAVPEGVTHIRAMAFSNCDFISEIILPNGLAAMGDQAFGPCRNLEKINIPTSVSHFGNYLFAGSGRVRISVGCGMLQQYEKIPQLQSAIKHMVEE